MRCLSHEVAKLVTNVASRLEAVARILFQTAPHDSRQITGQIRAQFSDGQWSIPQNRGDKLGRRTSFERPPAR